MHKETHHKYRTTIIQTPNNPVILNDLVHILTSRHAKGNGVKPILLASKSE